VRDLADNSQHRSRSTGLNVAIAAHRCSTGQHTGRAMRISDDRYDRERSSLDLALKFLRHEARTRTIRSWTGLSDDRIRNLYRS
jgi:hypothetical protein